MPRAWSCLAKSRMPVLSETLINAVKLADVDVNELTGPVPVHEYVYGDVPPDGVKLALPSFKPLQVIFVVDNTKLSTVGSVRG